MDGSSSMRCPNCSEPVAPDDFQCAACELLLDPDATQEVTEPSVVRAMLAPAMRRPSTELPAYVPEPEPVAALGDDRSTRPTALFMPLAADVVVPKVIAGLELAGQLRDLDAYVASFVDGRKTIAELARDTQLQEIEVHAVIRALEARKVVSLRQVTSATPGPQAPQRFPVARMPGAGRRKTTAPAPQPPTEDRFHESPPAPSRSALAPEPITAPGLPVEPAKERAARAAAAHQGSAVMRASGISSAPPEDARVPASPTSAPAPTPASTPASASAPAFVPTSAPAPERPAPVRRDRPSFVIGTRTAEHMLNLSASAPQTEPKPAAPRPRPRVQLDAPPTRFAADNEESVIQRAIAHERDGDIAGAIEVLQRGIARVKKPGPLYNKLALVLVAQRREYDRAEALLKQALELEPDNAVYQQNLFKVVALAASHTNPGKKPVGFLARLTGRK